MIIVIALVCYVGILIFLTIGLKKHSLQSSETMQPVSVIVAARNEEAYIGHCVDALNALDYPKSLLEIIIIDDNSTDSTAAILSEKQSLYPNIKILNSQHSSPSKKQALVTGIAQSNNEILAFTDADCVPPPTWIHSIIKRLTTEVGVVVGFSPLQSSDNKLLGHLIELDSLIAAIVAAGGLGKGVPISCTGRNFAYRKQVYTFVGGFSDIMHSLSGDDDLFLHLVRAKTNWKIVFNLDEEGFVPSDQKKSWRDFLTQKARHISAGKFYPFHLKLSYAFMHLFNIAVYAFFIVSLVIQKYICLSISVFVIKTVADFLFIRTGASLFKKEKLLRYVILWELFYLLYNLLSGSVAFLGKIHWKK